MRRFASNVGQVFGLLAIIALGLVALVLAIGFGYTVVEHLNYEPGYLDDGGAPPVAWWALFGAVAAVIGAVGIYTFLSRNETKGYYCPRCPCPRCREERRRRQEEERLMMAAAVGGAVGASIGGSS